MHCQFSRSRKLLQLLGIALLCLQADARTSEVTVEDIWNQYSLGTLDSAAAQAYIGQAANGIKAPGVTPTELLRLRAVGAAAHWLEGHSTAAVETLSSVIAEVRALPLASLPHDVRREFHLVWLLYLDSLSATRDNAAYIKESDAFLAAEPHDPLCAALAYSRRSWHSSKASDSKTARTEAVKAYEAWKNLREQTPLAIDVINATHVACVNSGERDKALEIIKSTAAMMESENIKQSPVYGALAHNLTSAYLSHGKYADAQSFARNALEHYKAAGRAESLNAAEMMNILANILRNIAALQDEKWRLDEAEELSKRASEIIESSPTAGPDALMRSMRTQAEILLARGKMPEAEKLHEKMIAFREKQNGKFHATTISALSSYAHMKSVMGRHADAVDLYADALQRTVKTWGVGSAQEGDALHDLGNSLVSMGKSHDAEERFTRALAIRERVLGPDHKDVGRTLHNLAWLLERNGYHEKAEGMYRRVLEISRKDPDPLNVQLLEDLGNLCRVLQTEGKIDEAISITLEIQAALERFGGEDHPFVAGVLSRLGDLYSADNKFPEAETALAKAMTIQEKAVGKDHHKIGEICLQFAVLFHRQNDFIPAERAARRAVLIYARSVVQNPGLSNVFEASKNVFNRISSLVGCTPDTIRRRLEELEHGNDPGKPPIE
jgi:tetratricopeptide (TPR) repeat protein